MTTVGDLRRPLHGHAAKHEVRWVNKRIAFPNSPDRVWIAAARSIRLCGDLGLRVAQAKERKQFGRGGNAG
jgi:hypothetical protein